MEPGTLNVDQTQLKKLSDKFYKQILKFDKNDHIKRINKDYDSGAVWISKADIDSLFQGCNELDPGLTIYFIVHDKNVLPELPEEYNNQLSLVLQVNYPSMAQIGKTPTSICPPATNCRNYLTPQ